MTNATTLSRLGRVLALIDAFHDGESVLTADELSSRTGNPHATGYRYIRELCEAGLLVRLPHGYALGPRIIEWDLRMRSSEPLLSAGRAVVDRLVSETGLELLLSQLYGERVINVHHEHQAANPMLNLGRGKSVPLFRSSTSRVILANLPPRELRRVYDGHATEPDVMLIGNDWKAFNRAMALVRERGYQISEGELGHDRTGIAAPIFGESGRVLGSITLIGASSRFQAYREDYITGLVVDAAAEITRLIAS